MVVKSVLSGPSLTRWKRGGELVKAPLPVLRRLIRPIYRQRGIIPEVATGLQAAAEGGTPRQ